MAAGSKKRNLQWENDTVEEHVMKRSVQLEARRLPCTAETNANRFTLFFACVRATVIRISSEFYLMSVTKCDTQQLLNIVQQREKKKK